ncbi:hypothetical protein [Vibrio sp. D431a]|uniref:hypothetical protein n=1 Tax=Vibrio sp. D431a TaxID=2837388 RepID=UPI002555FF7E|nr:hypothetical protein [Vibrio sp. D431a]MDK9790166.1 hypothetical protein [Vibrio sp. D431a]
MKKYLLIFGVIGLFAYNSFFKGNLHSNPSFANLERGSYSRAIQIVGGINHILESPRKLSNHDVEILTIGAEGGSGSAQWALGYYYLANANGDKATLNSAFNWLKASAKSAYPLGVQTMALVLNGADPYSKGKLKNRGFDYVYAKAATECYDYKPDYILVKRVKEIERTRSAKELSKFKLQAEKAKSMLCFG